MNLYNWFICTSYIRCTFFLQDILHLLLIHKFPVIKYFKLEVLPTSFPSLDFFLVLKGMLWKWHTSKMGVILDIYDRHLSVCRLYMEHELLLWYFLQDLINFQFQEKITSGLESQMKFICWWYSMMFLMYCRDHVLLLGAQWSAVHKSV